MKKLMVEVGIVAIGVGAMMLHASHPWWACLALGLCLTTADATYEWRNAD